MTDQKPQENGTNKPEDKSFWKTVPGILTGIAAVVTAVATLLAAADKAGFFTSDAPSPPSQANRTDTGGGMSTSGDNSPIIRETGGNVTFTGSND
ncbi:hypothetical protein [Aliiroseovarius sp. F47248L]|uniref:hypothetical protein n=1 Tax=Aliiroseovarius sp. F47248L TaxID=2926420 RepID=UPI001FF3F1BC|nr:hypothetical protein [Aliiroseovarius sp. F47248L]MCK0138675.1 hypothetical protein [Aliiroseovarius sp. F47248L]